ncbi:hypothetical protein OAT18_00905 [Tenacibaculum sp.]|nr:hypothetical protein [Tenacibaculum sp.]
MNPFLTIVKYDYLQRTRSYAFLITLCASLAIAYTFVPEPDANYSTIRISDYVGYYNSAWFGYVTAIMTSVFLSLIGFYLINNGIKTDIETKVGQIIATTNINNFVYLLSKVISNFLVLLTIVTIILSMSILLFFLYNDGYPFEILHFIQPYIIITIPAIFCISVLALIFEILFSKYSVIQNIAFFFLFLFLMQYTPKGNTALSIDVFGNKMVMQQLEKNVRKISNTDKDTNLTIGYILGNIKKSKKFEFKGVLFPSSFIISRFGWICLSLSLLLLISPFFHRFNIRERTKTKKQKTIIFQKYSTKELTLSNLPTPKVNYGIFPLIKTELILLIRKGEKWHWVINGIGMISLLIAPLSIAHQFILPILWFFQIHRISEITTKEIHNSIQYLSFTSYKPIYRLLASQLIAGVLLMFFLTIPLCIKLVISLKLAALFSIISGSVFIIFLASSLGILTKGKKLFEVLFFLITYTNINKIPFTDYFGGLNYTWLYVLKLTIVVTILGGISFLTRINQLKKI